MTRSEYVVEITALSHEVSEYGHARHEDNENAVDLYCKVLDHIQKITDEIIIYLPN